MLLLRHKMPSSASFRTAVDGAGQLALKKPLAGFSPHTRACIPPRLASVALSSRGESMSSFTLREQILNLGWGFKLEFSQQ